MSEELTFRIRDRKVLENIVANLHTTHAEILDTNPNMRPIQMHTKLKWQQSVGQTLEFLQKLLPSPAESDPKE